MASNPTSKLAETLNRLVCADLDLIEVYECALPTIDTPELAEKVGRFLPVHEEHVQRLSEMISQNGGSPPELDLDHESAIQGRMTSIGDTLDTAGAIRDLHDQERLAIERYETAMATDLGPAKALVESHLAQLRTHHDYLGHALVSVNAAAKLWGSQDRPWIMNH